MKNWGKAWTKKETEYLKKNMDKSDKELAKELGRTEGAIYLQKRKIKGE